MNTERRFDGGAWLTLAVAIGWAVGLLGLGIAALSRPTDGWVHQGPVGATGGYRAVLNISGASSKLQVNDLIIAIDDQALTPDHTPPLPADLQVGRSVRYRVLRGVAPQTVPLDVEVPLVIIGPIGLPRAILMQLQTNPRDYIVAAVSLIVVAVAFFLRPGNLGARYLLLVFSFYGFEIWLGLSFSALYSHALPLPLKMAYELAGPGVWGWYFFPSLTLMALAFPVVKAPLRRFPRLLPALLYGVPLAATAAAVVAERYTHETRWTTMSYGLIGVTGLLAIATIFATLIHNWLTLREPVARAQLRWLTLGLGVGLGGMLTIGGVAIAIFGHLPEAFNNILWLLILLPLSIVIAITRYRLFDIDVIVRRTLVYAALTTLLALAYLGSVVVLQSLFQLTTGQNQNQLATVVSTLAIAALFVPLRGRVQDFIDRRFYRRKYDAARILAQFGANVRDDVDLDDLTERLQAVVDATLEPVSIGVWVRPPQAQEPSPWHARLEPAGGPSGHE